MTQIPWGCDSVPCGLNPRGTLKSPGQTPLMFTKKSALKKSGLRFVAGAPGCGCRTTKHWAEPTSAATVCLPGKVERIFQDASFLGTKRTCGVKTEAWPSGEVLRLPVGWGWFEAWPSALESPWPLVLAWRSGLERVAWE